MESEARAKLRAFYNDIKAVCEKHGGSFYVADDDNNIIGLAVEGVNSNVVCLEVDGGDLSAWWAWGEEEERIAPERPVLPPGTLYAWACGLPPGTHYKERVTKTEPL